MKCDGHASIYLSLWHLFDWPTDPCEREALWAGNISTDEWGDAYGVLAGLLPGIPKVVARLTDSLEDHYGIGPAANDGRVQHLHACRIWTSNNEHREELIRLGSSYESLESLRQSIITATHKAIECWNGDGTYGFEWIGHAMHIIEDSFTIGHTERAAEMNWNLVSFSVSGGPLPYYLESGWSRVTGLRHCEVARADQAFVEEGFAWEGISLVFTPLTCAAVLADLGYLHVIRELRSQLHFPLGQDIDGAKRKASELLLEYFENETFLNLSGSNHRVSGYFKHMPLTPCNEEAWYRYIEVPLYIDSFRTTWNVWNKKFAPFYHGGQPRVLEYDKRDGAVSVYDCHLRPDNELWLVETPPLQSIERGFWHILPFQGPGRDVLFLAYPHLNGRFLAFSRQRSMSQVPLIQNIFQDGLHIMVPMEHPLYGSFLLGYSSTSGLLYGARMTVGNPETIDGWVTERVYLDGQIGSTAPGYSIILPIRVRTRKPSLISSFAQWIQSTLHISWWNFPETYLLLYSQNTGVASFFRVDFASRDPSFITRLEPRGEFTIGPGWTSASCFQTARRAACEKGDHTYIILLSQNDGRAHVFRLQVNTAVGKQNGYIAAMHLIREGRYNGENAKLVPFYPKQDGQDCLLRTDDHLSLFQWEDDEWISPMTDIWRQALERMRLLWRILFGTR